MTDQKPPQRQGFTPEPPVSAPAPEWQPVLLDDGPDKGEIWERFMGNLIARNTQQAKLYPFAPASDSANGETVIILPGGGYQMLAMEHEGFKAATRLADLGYQAYVLSYRTHPTSVETAAFFQEMGVLFRQLGQRPLPENPDAVADLGTAVAHVKRAGGDYINLLGFSAGARTILRYLEGAEAGSALARIGLVYPPMAPIQMFNSDAPTFVTAAADDPLLRAHQLELVSDLMRMGKQVEFHLFERGGHGFGMAQTGTTSEAWFDTYVNWLSKSER